VEAATGTAQKTVGLQRLRRFKIPVAPLHEQQRIVDTLDSCFTRLDDAVATLKCVERDLRRYRASVLKAAVEGQLVPTEATLARQEGRAYETASVLLDRILTERKCRWLEFGRKDKYQEPVPPDTTDLPSLPEGWCWATMDALIVEGPQNGIYVPKSQYGRGTPILRIEDYQSDWSRLSSELQMIAISNDEAITYGLRANDLVINRVNSPSHLGKTLLVTEQNLPAVFESNMMRMSLTTSVIGRYIQNYLSSVDGKQRLIGNAKWAVNQASINQRDVGCTPVPLPPLLEQARILEEVSRLMSAVQASRILVEKNTVRCRRLRQAVLKCAFEGKLADQDPKDEPASLLLERIKVERETIEPVRTPGAPRAGKKKQVRA
jgi:type I restriction enzyme S subunit